MERHYYPHTYDADGLRATKTVDGVKHTYLYVGGQLLYEKWSDKELYFWYDGNGHLIALRYYYNDDGDYSTLYAMTNAMGDVLGLYSVAGNPVVTYEYDAWGRLINLTDNTSLGTGTINPIRYRGYYYDTDSGLYYCQSRYYNPRVGRWVNADGQLNTDAILGANMFAYSYNNPIVLKDNGGNRPISALSVAQESGTERKASCATMRQVMPKKKNSFIEKLNKVAIACVNSLEFEGGLGAGIKLGVSFASAEADIGMKGDFVNIQLSKEDGFVAQSKLEAGITVGIGPYTVGPEYTSTHPLSCACGMGPCNNIKTQESLWNEEFAFDIIGVGGYLLYGGEISLKFNLVTFYEEMIVIYEE